MSEQHWPNLAVGRPDGPPLRAAIESWFKAGVSLAVAWNVDGKVVVAVTDHVDLADAVEQLRNYEYRGSVIVGKSMVHPVKDPALKGVRATAGEGRVGAAVSELVRLFEEDVFRHDGLDHLGEQVLAARTLPSADGARLVSSGRADAIKAAVWAGRAARIGRRPGSVRLVTARK